jgi:acyl-CoA synthetase (AMP-forming)/AMP-acid ligase II
MTYEMSIIDEVEDGASLGDVIDLRAAVLGAAPWMLSLRSDNRVTYQDLHAKVEGWRAVIRSLGLQSGERVGMLIFDPVDYAVSFVALISAGLWVAPLDPNVLFANSSRIDERARHLRLSYIVSDRAAPASVECQWLDTSAETSDAESPTSSATHANSQDGGVILATSGTSGTPKVTALASSQLICAARLVARHNLLATTDRGFNALPLWHINAEVVGVLATLMAGASLVLDDGFHRTDFWALMEKYEVTWINAVPAIISRLILRQPGESIPARIRFIRSASAPLSTLVLREFEESTGIVVIESYGMTEAASQICANPVNGRRKGGSVGPAVGVELRVTPSRGSQRAHVGHHRVGSIAIRGRSVIRRYEGAGYEDRFDSQGWLTTGDLGYLDDDGYLFLVGRVDDVINRSGEKIFPREIEDVLLGLPGVISAAVVGVPDEVFGHVPVAYLQIDQVTAATPHDEIRASVEKIEKALVSSFARARRPASVVIVEKMPVHATGKVQKNLLGTETVRVLYDKDL